MNKAMFLFLYSGTVRNYGRFTSIFFEASTHYSFLPKLNLYLNVSKCTICTKKLTDL